MRLSLVARCLARAESAPRRERTSRDEVKRCMYGFQRPEIRHGLPLGGHGLGEPDGAISAVAL